jgi:hypothetical protein
VFATGKCDIFAIKSMHHFLNWPASVCDSPCSGSASKDGGHRRKEKIGDTLNGVALWQQLRQELPSVVSVVSVVP